MVKSRGDRKRRTVVRGGRHTTYAPPSQLALATVVSDFGFLTRTSTASECPSRLATKGLANIRSIFAAFKARVLSLARANGCSSGSRFLEVGVGSPGRIGRCVDGSCCSTEIFCPRVGSHSMRGRQVICRRSRWAYHHDRCNG